MSQLTHRQVPFNPARVRTVLVATIVAAVLAAAAITAAIAGSDGESTPSQVKPGDAPALRSDGGPEESTRGAIGTAQSPGGGAALRSDGGPEESTRLR